VASILLISIIFVIQQMFGTHYIQGKALGFYVALYSTLLNTLPICVSILPCQSNHLS
jgi:hypothetical protein